MAAARLRRASALLPYLYSSPTPARLIRPTVQHKLFSQTTRRYAETVVKVPQMAESISEGTLSSFSKQVGDRVEQDEEIASIETDKIDVSVNAPTAGVITEILVSEGDTVTVGQDLAKIDEGGEGGDGSKEAKEEPKSPASSDKPTSSDPEPKKDEGSTAGTTAEESAPPPKKEEKKPEPKKEEKPAPPKQEKKPAPAKEEKKPETPKSSVGDAPAGSRGEHRVCSIFQRNGTKLICCR